IRPDLDDAAARPGNGPAQQEQVLVWDHVDDLVALLGHALVPHLPGAADALEDPRGRRRRADRAQRADRVRSVRDGPAREVVPLHGPLEALALRDARDFHGLALLE